MVIAFGLMIHCFVFEYLGLMPSRSAMPSSSMSLALVLAPPVGPTVMKPWRSTLTS